MELAVPQQFLDVCDAEERKEVEAWWEQVTSGAKSEVAVLVDTRNESCVYILTTDEEGQESWRSLPITDDALPADDSSNNDEWIDDFIHYRLDHEDLILSADMKPLVFHICTQHSAAQDVMERGKIEESFQCSAAGEECPIYRFVKKNGRAFLIGRQTNSSKTLWLCQRGE